jgi:hypothetical protein
VAHGLVVGPGDDGHLLHVEALRQLCDALGDLRAGADERVPEHLIHASTLGVRIGMPSGHRWRIERHEDAEVA